MAKEYSTFRPVNVPKSFRDKVAAPEINYAGALATADNQAYTVTYAEAEITGLGEGMSLLVKMPTANSAGAATLDVNGTGALKLIKASDQVTQVALDDLVASGTYQVVYNADLDSGSGAWVVLNV